MSEVTPEDRVLLWRSLFVSMTRTFNEVETQLKADVGLTLLDLGILFSLGGGGAQPMGALAGQFGVDASVVTYRIDRLERMGHVTREPSDADRRMRNASITTVGRRALKQGRESMLAAADEHFFAYLERDDLPAMTRIFQGIHAKGRARVPCDS
jgi:DNA-binding MarR family transcriptional regulator